MKRNEKKSSFAISRLQKLKMIRLMSSGAFSLSLALAGPADNSLIIGTTQEPANILDYWQTNSMRVAREINGFMTGRLTYRNAHGELIPEIAETIPTLENGDYKIYRVNGKVLRNSVTYRIRKDAKWSDGTPITSKDFKFWLDVARNPNVPVASREPWNHATMSIKNDGLFVITFSPAYLFADQVPPGLAPAHVMEGGYQKFKEDALKTGSGNMQDLWLKFLNYYMGPANAGSLAISSGPFKLTYWKIGQYMRLSRNTNYWRIPEGGSDKYLQSITYKFVSNSNTLRINTFSRQIDVTSPVGLTFDQVMNMFNQDKYNLEPVFGSAGGYEFIAIAQKGRRAEQLELTDKRIRAALAYSIDRSQVLKVLFNGNVSSTSSWVSPGVEIHNGNLKNRDYDPNKARQLFAEAGWKPGADGILTKNGIKMSLNLSSTAGNVTRERMEQIFKDQWRKVGVDVKINNLPGTVLFSNNFLRKCEDGNWDLVLMSNSSIDPITDVGDIYASASIPTQNNAYAGSNFSKYSSLQYDSTWSEARYEFNKGRRINLINKLQEIVDSDAASIFLYSLPDSYVRPRDLANFNFNVYTRVFSWDAYRIGWKSRGAVEEK